MGGAGRSDRSRPDARASMRRVDVRGVVQKSFVDYTGRSTRAVRSDVQIRPGGRRARSPARLRHLGVDGTQNRGDQTGISR